MSGTNPLRRVLWPADTPGAKPSVLAAVRRVVAGVWLTASTATITVWLLIFIIGGNLLYPFWIWSLSAGAVLVTVLWLIAEQQGRVR